MSLFDLNTRTAPEKNRVNESVMGEDEFTVNPFVHRVMMSSKQRRRYLIMSFTVAPFRLLLCLILLFLTWICAFFFTIGVNNNFEKPVHPFRRRLFKIVCRLFSISTFFLGIKVQVSRLTCIFICNYRKKYY